MPRRKQGPEPPPMTHASPWATRKEIAAYLRKDITTIDRMLSGKTTPKLTRHKIGRDVLISWAEVEALFS